MEQKKTSVNGKLNLKFHIVIPESRNFFAFSKRERPESFCQTKCNDCAEFSALFMKRMSSAKTGPEIMV